MTSESFDSSLPLIAASYQTHYTIISPKNSTNINGKIWTKDFAKCLIAALSTLRNISFIPLSLELPLGKWNWTFAIGNVIGVTALDYWAGSLFLEKIFSEKLDSIKKPHIQKYYYSKILAHCLNPLIALSSQLPGIYAALDYNKNTLKIPIAIVVGLGGALLPLRSTQLTIDRFFEYLEAKELGIDIKEKEAFIQQLNKAKGTFVNLTEEEQKAFIEELNEIKKLPDNPDKIQRFWSKMLDVSSSSEVETTPQTTPLYAVKATGLAITAIYQYVIGIYTFVKTQEEIWDNKAFAGVLSAIVVASSQFLIGSAIVDSTVRIFENVTGINKQARLQNRQLIEKLRSKSLIPLIGLGIVVNLLSLGVTATIWNDFFTDQKQKIAFETLMCIAIFLLIDAAIPALIKDIVSNHVKNHGTQEEKDSMHQVDEYQTIMNLIAKMPLQDFQEFIENIPRDIKDLPSDIHIINSPLHEHA